MDPTQPKEGGIFPNTRWSLVLEICGGGDKADRALDELCGIYWYPVYAYLRGSGVSPSDAEDLTQSFFARLIGKEILERADSAKGRLRCFLLHALKHFKIDEYRKASAQKRGGDVVKISIDTDEAEERFSYEPSHHEDPAVLFERRWARALLEEAFVRLEEDYERSGKIEMYRQLQPFVAGDGAPGITHADAAGKLGMTTGAVQVAVHRLRKRYRLALEAAIAETVDSAADVEEEMSHILLALAPSS